jgi:hypothetical protein
LMVVIADNTIVTWAVETWWKCGKISISKSSIILTSMILTLSSCTNIEQASPEGPRLGRVASLSDIKRLDISVAPDGLNLPVGHGNAEVLSAFAVPIQVPVMSRQKGER